MHNEDKSELRIEKEDFFEIWRAFARGNFLHARSAFFIAAAAAFSPWLRQETVFIRTPVRFSPLRRQRNPADAGRNWFCRTSEMAACGSSEEFRRAFARGIQSPEGDR